MSCCSCLCLHCANNVDNREAKLEEREYFCYNCDECGSTYGCGHRSVCSYCKITKEEVARLNRKKIRLIDKEK